MVVRIKNIAYVLIILCLPSSNSFDNSDIDKIMDFMHELRRGITTGFQDQWRLLQKLR